MINFRHFVILATIFTFGFECTLSQPLYLFHQGPNQALYSDIWANYNGQNPTWGPDTLVPNTFLAYGPTAVYLSNGNIIVFHQGDGDGTLWANTLQGNSWAGDTQISIPNTNQAGVGATYFGSTLYVIYQQVGGNLWYLTSQNNGASFSAAQQIPGVSASETPYAVEFKSKLYVFFQGSGYNGLLYYVSFDGSNWSAQTQVPNTGTSQAPSGFVQHYEGESDLLGIYHQGSGGNGQLWLNAFDGTNWAGDVHLNWISEPVASNSGPAVVFINNEIQIFYVGTNGLVYWVVGTSDAVPLNISGATRQLSAVTPSSSR